MNRNFPDQFFDSGEVNAEPESMAVMDWLKKYPFSLSASFHSGALVVTYPFDDSPSGKGCCLIGDFTFATNHWESGLSAL